MPASKFKLEQNKFFAAAKKAGVAARLEDELYWFARLLRENYDLKLFLEDARLSAAYKKKRLAEILPAHLSQNFRELVDNLINAGRREMFTAVAREFSRRLSQETGLVIGEVLSAAPLTKGNRQAVEKVMSKIKKAPVLFRYRLVPTLLGGICVNLSDGEVWNVSLDYKLGELKEALVK